MDTPTHRPGQIRVQLGPTLNATETHAVRDLVRPAIEGLGIGIAVGFAVGTRMMPSSVAVFLIGGLALAYALLSFLLERP